MECCTRQQEQFAAYISGESDTATDNGKSSATDSPDNGKSSATDSPNNGDSSATALKFASLSQLGFMLLLASFVSALV